MRLIRQHKAGLGPRPSSAQPFLGSQPDEEPIPLHGVWARPPPPPALPAESSAPAESDDESMSVACSATVESFEDFFQDPDGSGARVAAAALSGNREKLASCLRRHPMLSARPRPCVAGLPGSMEFWTVREYVHLAKLRAEDVGDEDRAEAFSEMLDSVDAAERQQAEALVRSFLNHEMTRVDARRFRENLKGRAFSVFQSYRGGKLTQLLNSILHSVQLDELQRLLREDFEDVNPLKPRSEDGHCCHPQTVCWPLRTFVLARIAFEMDERAKEPFRQALQILRSWEDDLVRATHLHFSALSDEENAALRLLLRENV